MTLTFQSNIFSCAKFQMTFTIIFSSTSSNSTKIYHEKLVKRCHHINKVLSTECHKSFTEAFDNCLKNRDRRECSNAFQSADSICGQKATENFNCNPSSVIDSNFGNKYSTMMKLGRKFVVQRNISRAFAERGQVVGVTKMKKTLKKKSRFNLETFVHLEAFQFLISTLMFLLYIKVVYGECRCSFRIDSFQHGELLTSHRVSRCNKVSRRLPEQNSISKFLHHWWFEENRFSS